MYIGLIFVQLVAYIRSHIRTYSLNLRGTYARLQCIVKFFAMYIFCKQSISYDCSGCMNLVKCASNELHLCEGIFRGCQNVKSRETNGFPSLEALALAFGKSKLCDFAHFYYTLLRNDRKSCETHAK
uniref:Uncharacterized protein n=1 Tax=Rhipicephalus microplus TaxID=6941 RepID=A0A6G5A333_RHIMP